MPLRARSEGEESAQAIAAAQVQGGEVEHLPAPVLAPKVLGPVSRAVATAKTGSPPGLPQPGRLPQPVAPPLKAPPPPFKAPPKCFLAISKDRSYAQVAAGSPAPRQSAAKAPGGLQSPPAARDASSQAEGLRGPSGWERYSYDNAYFQWVSKGSTLLFEIQTYIKIL